MKSTSHLHLSPLVSLCWLALLVLASCGDEVSDKPGAASDGGPCTTVEECPPGAFACSSGRCQLPQMSTCPKTGLGPVCSFESDLDGKEYTGRCIFRGDMGEYYCHPDCTAQPCAQEESVCHPVQPTGQAGDWKACIAPCTSTYQCLGGTWACNSDGQCVVPNEAVCVGKATLENCDFEGSDGAVYQGICSAPPPTIDGPPYYSETNLCVRICDPEDPSTCDRIKGVCQPAEPEGAGSAPDGSDYSVCVAPVCNGDEDCTGGMFGCEDAVCVLPSYTACEGLQAGSPCLRTVRGESVPAFCGPSGICLPSCVPDSGGPGTCVTHPDSTVCQEFNLDGATVQALCVDPAVAGE